MNLPSLDRELLALGVPRENLARLHTVIEREFLQRIAELRGLPEPRPIDRTLPPLYRDTYWGKEFAASQLGISVRTLERVTGAGEIEVARITPKFVLVVIESALRWRALSRTGGHCRIRPIDAKHAA